MNVQSMLRPLLGRQPPQEGAPQGCLGQAVRGSAGRGSPARPQVPGDLGGQLPTFDEPDSVAGLGVRERLAPPAQVLAGGPAISHRVGDPFPCDFQFYRD